MKDDWSWNLPQEEMFLMNVKTSGCRWAKRVTDAASSAGWLQRRKQSENLGHDVDLYSFQHYSSARHPGSWTICATRKRMF